MSLASNNPAFAGSPQVNLLPAAYEVRCRRARRLRSWVVLGAMLLALQVTAAVALREMGTKTRDLQQGLMVAENQQQSLKKRIQGLAAQQADLDKQLELAEHLNRKHRWSELLSHLSDTLPPTVVLVGCESNPPKSTAKGQEGASVRPAADKGKGPAEPADVATGLVITGVATDHGAVAALLRKLNESGKLGRCSLESTQRQAYLKGEGVFFTIRTQW